MISSTIILTNGNPQRKVYICIYVYTQRLNQKDKPNMKVEFVAVENPRPPYTRIDEDGDTVLVYETTQEALTEAMYQISEERRKGK